MHINKFYTQQCNNICNMTNYLKTLTCVRGGTLLFLQCLHLLLFIQSGEGTFSVLLIQCVKKYLLIAHIIVTFLLNSFNHGLSPQAMIKFAHTLRSSRNTSHHMTLEHLRFHASNDGVQNQELLHELRQAIPSVDLWSLHSGSDYDTFIAEQQSQM